MSNIGKQPIPIPDGVEITRMDNEIFVKGKLGELSQIIDSEANVAIEENEVVVTRSSDEKRQRELHGLTRVLIANMVEGVTNGYQKELNLVGVGYSADASKGNFLLLNLGFSHPIYYEKPEGITFETPNSNTVLIKGINKQEVGQVAANIRELRKPEPYKGKGIKYSDEYVRRKAGKSIGAVA
ncbi:MAG: 50S ribosomal protein L6 [Candidatus Marinimicrobia bacterium]|jgi:large subunit ribosomal protein L6|nr:50S ribosomal protein L6 [Candidatus Neomarinimicrobiota bacterium]MDP6853348.1 50S ribosomal protein L6 [Candidatus Neomarinimicrobiota bacterium]MDP6936312.1 50S ribosomal protein L6 [Candidatus Neomarinimicrobiota bacterium]